jgi:hypothetical protein
MNRLDIIQQTINQRKASNYLEIGVKKGKIFLYITARKKIAVDPKFKINFKNKRKAWWRGISNFFNEYYEMTSDDFFERHHRRLQRLGGIDVAFIDGLHRYEQSLKDVQKCLIYLRPKGVIIMHDCNPASEAEAAEVDSREQAPRTDARGRKLGWSGDVWKTIAHLRSTRKDLGIFVLDCDHGVGIITKDRPECSLDFTPEKIMQLTYKDLENNREQILNLKPPEYLQQFLSAIN